MGCGPSQAVIIQPTSDQNLHLQPTLYMVAEETFQMLRELGELKFYHLAQYGGESDEAQDLHRDFAARLENPVEYLRNEKGRSDENDQAKSIVRCADNLKTDRIVSRASTLYESKDQIRTYSNDQSPLLSSQGPQELVARGMTNSICFSEMFENPTKFRGSSANFRDFVATKFSGEKADTVELHGTLETRLKSKTFFGRNRVKPKDSSVASRYGLSSVSDKEASGTRSINPTKIGKLTTQDVTPGRSVSEPCIGNSQNPNP